MFDIKDFYCQERGTKVVSFEPREEFVTLDCSLLSSKAESAAYCTNSKTPYVRVCPSVSKQSDKGKRLSRGIGWTIATSGEYAAATEKERNKQYPIAAKGYAAFLLSKAEYDTNRKCFRRIDKAIIEDEYYNLVLRDDSEFYTQEQIEEKKKALREETTFTAKYFNSKTKQFIVELVNHFKVGGSCNVIVAETAILPKESASQIELQDVRDLFSSDEDYNTFMRKAKEVDTSNGYKRLIEEINPSIFNYKDSIKNVHAILSRHKDDYFPKLRGYQSFRQTFNRKTDK